MSAQALSSFPFNKKEYVLFHEQMALAQMINNGEMFSDAFLFQTKIVNQIEREMNDWEIERTKELALIFVS